MLGVLIESRAGKQRRSGGAVASVVLHGAIIAGAVAVTAKTSPARQTDGPVVADVKYIKTPPPDEHPQPRTTTRQPNTIVVPPNTMVVSISNIIPSKLPPIGVSTNFDPSKVVIVAGSGPISHNPLDTVSTFGRNDVFRSDAVERIASLVEAPRPQYPENLRLAGVSGRVLVQFVVDTTGRVEKESVHVLEASHARFENAVRDVLPRLRFRAAEIGDSKVRMLVQMPFEFSIDTR